MSKKKPVSAFIGIKAKLAAEHEIYEELQSLGLKPHALFGNFDIICKIPKFVDIDEFKKKWFEPIRKIGGGNNYIQRTTTFLILDMDDRDPPDDTAAFALVCFWPSQYDQIMKLMRQMKNVASVDAVLGQYDAVCSVVANNKAALASIIEQVRLEIPGIISTETMQTRPMQ